MRPTLPCLTLLLAATTASAGTVYRCKQPDGSTYFSDRACPSASQPEVIKQEHKLPTVEASVSNALDPRCQYLRTVLQGGKHAYRESEGGQSYGAMRNEYQTSCADAEMAARRRLQSEQQMAAEENAARQREANRVRQEANAQRARCVEQSQFIEQRRGRVETMGPGERGDYDRALAQFEARCRGL